MAATNKQLLISESHGDSNRCTPSRKNPDQHDTYASHASPRTSGVSFLRAIPVRGNLSRSHQQRWTKSLLPRKKAPDTIHNTPAEGLLLLHRRDHRQALLPRPPPRDHTLTGGRCAALDCAEVALDHSRTLKATRRALAADELAATATAHDFLAIDACFPTDDYLRRDLLDIKRHLKGLARRRLEAAIDTARADLLPPPIKAAGERCEGEEECEEMEEDRRGR
jgi:hypothetical protein